MVMGERPRPQPRPRAVRNGRKTVIVSTMDKNAQRWRRIVGKRFRDALREVKEDAAKRGAGELTPVDGPVGVEMVFLFAVKDRKKHMEFMTGTPDTDNLQKLVLDVVEESGFFNKGDAQVARSACEKYWVDGDARQEGVIVRFFRPQNVLRKARNASGKASDDCISQNQNAVRQNAVQGNTHDWPEELDTESGTESGAEIDAPLDITDDFGIF